MHRRPEREEFQGHRGRARGRQDQGRVGRAIVQTQVSVTNVGLGDDASQEQMAAEAARLIRKITDPMAMAMVHRATQEQCMLLIQQARAARRVNIELTDTPMPATQTVHGKASSQAPTGRDSRR